MMEKTIGPLLLKCPPFANNPALLVVILVVVLSFQAQASALKIQTRAFRCIDILEGLGRIKEADPARSFEAALEVLSVASVLEKHPRLKRVRDMLAS